MPPLTFPRLDGKTCQEIDRRIIALNIFFNRSLELLLITDFRILFIFFNSTIKKFGEFGSAFDIFLFYILFFIFLI